MDYKTMKVVVERPWTTPSTKVDTIPYTAWKNIHGNDCEPDTDWEPEDDAAVHESGYNERKRHRTD